MSTGCTVLPRMSRSDASPDAGDEVVAALGHERHHFVRCAGDLHIDLAAGVFLELVSPSRSSCRSRRARCNRPRRRCRPDPRARVAAAAAPAAGVDSCFLEQAPRTVSAATAAMTESASHGSERAVHERPLKFCEFLSNVGDSRPACSGRVTSARRAQLRRATKSPSNEATCTAFEGQMCGHCHSAHDRVGRGCGENAPMRVRRCA